MTAKTASDMALDALQLIARHEQECGLRWGEATAELKYLREQVERHGKRWERLAWLLIGSMCAMATAVVTKALP